MTKKRTIVSRIINDSAFLKNSDDIFPKIFRFEISFEIPELLRFPYERSRYHDNEVIYRDIEITKKTDNLGKDNVS